MKKDKTWSDEYNAMMKNFSRKKAESIKELEELKKKVLFNIDARIDKLYHKRNYLKEVFANKKELRKHKISVWKKVIRTNFFVTLKFIFSMPFIYLMILPGILMHVCMEIYHQVCFRLYRIPLVKPKEFFIFDRRLLPQLNWLEKFNCFYCSYYNCLVSYMQEIVGRTERYWCPIKHSRRMTNPHGHYEQFVDYSESKDLRKKWKKLREFEEFKK